MSEYIVQSGDTFATIARKVYGTEQRENFVRSANPGAPLAVGAAELLKAGTSIIIPEDPTAPTDQIQNTNTGNPEEVSILIRGKRFRYWSTISISRSMVNIDSFTLTAPFEPDNQDFRESFRPFKYDSITILVGGRVLFSGTMVSIIPSQGADRRTLTVSGYAKPGVLRDCNAPETIKPLEFEGQTLKEMSQTLISPFGLFADFRDDPGAAFDTVSANPSTKVLAFLSKLAAQRKLVISNTTSGSLLFWREASGIKPVATLKESPVLTVTPAFNPQSYYSHITGQEPGLAVLNYVESLKFGSIYTVKNDRLKEVLRPHTFMVPDTASGDMKAAVETNAGRMFANMVSYRLEVPTWRDPAGALWSPNTRLKLTAPGAMVYSEYEFTIRSIKFARDNTKFVASLDLILPGSLSGQIPEKLPWE